MAYESLYRRYRPQRFSEVRGQDHVVAALHNAVRENRVGHAYLLSGPRGTGKTTTARVLAKALNCTDLVDGEPCGACDSCKAIEAGTSYDLLELDAASNNGVDAMRDLIAKAALGSPGRTKVYLLDEVHMLSTGASNALLKTLEEPPGHVVFVLATTDPHKVLPTIRSRTQHFELHLLPADELRRLVTDVIADAGLELDADAVDYALRVGGGSARDTLSTLDQVVAAGGVLDRGDQVDDLVDALVAADTGTALRAVADAVSRGHDPRVVGEALLARIRDVFLHRMGDPLAQATDAERTKATEWAEHYSDRDCTRALEAVGDALRDMRTAPDARIPLEVALVRLTRVDIGVSLDSLAARVERLEMGAPPAAPVGEMATGATDGRPETLPPSSRPNTNAGAGRPADAARAALGGRPGGTGERSAPTDPTQHGAASEMPSAPEVPVSTAPVPPGGSSAPRPPSAAPAVPANSRTPDGASLGSPSQNPVPPGPGPSESASIGTRSADAHQPDAQPSVASPAQAVSAQPESGPSDDLASAWETQILPRLSGLTKAMFSVAHYVGSSGNTARFSVPNDVHRSKSMQKVAEVEAAIAAQLGREVKLQLIVEGTTGGASVDGTVQRTAAPREVPVGDEADEIGPIDELEDAPADDRSATQRVIDAFPGAEVVEG